MKQFVRKLNHAYDTCYCNCSAITENISFLLRYIQNKIVFNSQPEHNFWKLNFKEFEQYHPTALVTH